MKQLLIALPLMAMMAMMAMILMTGCDGATTSDPSTGDPSGCRTDWDCKGDRVCVDGKCVNPTDGDTDTAEDESDGDTADRDTDDDVGADAEGTDGDITENDEDATELEQSDEPCIPGEWDNQSCPELQGTCPAGQLCLDAYCRVYDGRGHYNASEENPEVPWDWEEGDSIPEGYGPVSAYDAPDSSVKRWLEQCTNWAVWECDPKVTCDLPKEKRTQVRGTIMPFG